MAKQQQQDDAQAQASDVGTNQPTPDKAPADEQALEHTNGGVTTRDAMDAGVAMVQGSPDEPVGPEDALGPDPTRGDYSDRLVSGPSMVSEVIPEEERTPDGPLYRLVPQAGGVRVDAAAPGAQPGGEAA
jgi:hypothetical protein